MKPLTIATSTFDSPLALAPMAGFTDIIWRRLLDELGGVAFMVTELISAEAICRRSDRTLSMIEEFRGRTPQFLQLFGADTESLCEAARIIEGETGFAGIDLNLGCPARKVIRKGAGSALLLDLPKLAILIRRLRKEVKGILTAKIRLGVDSVTAPDVAAMLQEEGIDALAVHFRLQQQGYNQPADWSWAGIIKNVLHIPLIGNGDVFDELTVRKRLEQTDGLLLGRASMHDPLLFARMCSINPLPKLSQVIMRFFELVDAYLPPDRGLNRIKAQARFLSGRKRSSRQIRVKIHNSRELGEAKAHMMSLVGEEEGEHAQK